MRMLKVRKKSISLIVVLTFLMTLFPLALPAFAATDYEALSVPSFSDDTNDAELGDILVTIDNLAPGLHQAEISLPDKFDLTYTDFVNSAELDAITGLDYAVDWASDNSLILTLNNTSGGMISDLEVIVSIEADIPSGAEGDITATIDNVTGQLYGGDVRIGKIASGNVTVKVTDDANFSEDGGWVWFRLTETAQDTFSADDTLDLVLPDGYTFTDMNDEQAYTVYGDSDVKPAFSYDDEELSISFNESSDIKTSIGFRAWVDVDFDEAEYGDVMAKIKGDYDATPTEVKVGQYGDYKATIVAADPETVAYAGRLDQEVSNITIEEDTVGSLVYGRMINLELPDNARWTSIDGNAIDPNVAKGDFAIDGKEGDVELTYWGLAGDNDNILRFKVTDESQYDPDTIKIEDIEVALEAGVTGDLVVDVTSSAGLEEDAVTIAKVVNPVTVKAEKNNVIIGKNGQPAGNITITEYDAEAILKGDLIIKVDEDIEFAKDPDVKVTEGDLKIGDVEADGDELTIEIDRDSNDASTIEISGILYDVDRTVAEGDLKADVGGDALIETCGMEYPVVKDKDNAIWEKSDSVAEFVSAVCVTPAPGEQQIKAVFTLSSTNYTLNDVAQTMDVAPYAKDGRTYLPMRYVAKALGIADTGILWKNGTATFVSADKVVSVTIGSQIMYINGAAVPIDAAPEIVNGRTMLPIRWIATAFGVNVSWDAAAQTVTVD